MIVVLENTDAAEAQRQPFFMALASRGALLSHVSAEDHPSQPNYLAMVAGSTYDVKTDDNVTLNARHVGDLLEEAGLNWKVYAENYPGNCFLGATSDVIYVRKHVPFLSFTDVQNDASRCARVVNASDFANDVRNGTLPAFSFYVPNLINDGHDTGPAYADNWLRTTFQPLLDDPRFTAGMLLVVTYDESESYLPGENTVAAVLVGDAIAPGASIASPLSHYSLLRLTETLLGVGTLNAGDTTAAPIEGIWKNDPARRAKQ